MKRRSNFSRLKLSHLMVGGALAVLAGPITAMDSASGATTVKGIDLRQTRSGLVLTLETSGDSPQMVSATSGKTLQAEIAHAQLQLPNGKSFSQKKSCPWN